MTHVASRHLTPALLALLALAGCSAEEPAGEAPLRPVRSALVRTVDSAPSRTFVGTARAGTESNLSFRVGGTLESLPARVGLTVDRGAVLAQLDREDRTLQVREAEAGLAQAEAGRRNATAEYERARALYENRNASKSQLDAARAQFESSAAQVEAGRSRLALARSQLTDTTLRAPYAGTVASVPVEVNENVQPGQSIVVLASGAAPEVEFGAPEVVVSGIRAGDPAEVGFSAIPGRSFSGTVTEVGVSVGRSAATYPVRVRLDDVDAAIRPGMAAEVRLRLHEEGAATRQLVPTVAVGEDREGRFVFVVEPAADDTAVVRRRGVEVGDLTADGLEILSGLEPGERVATAGVRRLSDGLRVRLLGDGA